MPAPADFQGLRVVAFESRMAADTARLIERHGGQPLVAPALREVPLDENPEAFAFGEQLLAGGIDLVIFLTGSGTDRLLDVLQTRYSLADLTRALSSTTLVARGPKPTAALKRVGLQPHLIAPEPNTSEDVLQVIDEGRPVRGLRVAVQEYGVPNDELVQALAQRGAEVSRVPVYRWALPTDAEPLHRAIESILAGHADVMLVTNAVQVDHVLQLVEPRDLPSFHHAVARMVVASIGPTASARLRHHQIPPDLEPTHPKLGILVKEAAQQAKARLVEKRREGRAAEP